MAGKTENLVSWKPGQSGNPGGKTSAQRKLEVENAEKATRIRAALLDQVVTLIDAGMVPELEANLLSLIKSSEDRGLGSPKATLAGDPENPLLPPLDPVERARWVAFALAEGAAKNG